MVNVDYVVERADTTGTVEAGSDATDAQFFTPAEFAASDCAMTATHVDRFGTDSIEWVVDNARAALDGA
jgi:hypothetical protein